MSEKRKPELVFFAYHRGKNSSTRRKVVKCELFPASLWEPRAEFGIGRQSGLMAHETRGDVYRVRVNGKWYPPRGKPCKKTTLTLSEFFAIFRRSVKAARAAERQKERRAR